ncbi:RIP metalloprotease RseP [bacterium]|nr:MAG: RIP metalloprotease RseP [bacterium]
MILTIIIFVAILSLLVFVHELGHFLFAKRAGMGVHEFGFGFPPRVFGIQKQDGKWRLVWGKGGQAVADSVDQGQTVYSVNAIPLGGFVKIMGEDNNEAKDPRSFTNKSFIARFLTLFAGVAMNVLAAWVILSVGFMIGLPVAINGLDEVPSGARFSQQQILIGGVREGSAAEAANIKESDIILSVDGQQFTEIETLQDYIRSKAGQTMSFEVKRINEIVKTEVVTETQNDPTKGVVGVGLAYYGKMQFQPHVALWQGAKTTVNQLKAIFSGIAKIFTSEDGVKGVGGPVKIAQLTGQVADLGLLPLLQFTAFLSLNLAILNSLPFPALDGGRMLFLIIEKLRGKPNNQSVEQYANAIGFMLLLLLMVVITVRDVSQLESIKNLFS